MIRDVGQDELPFGKHKGKTFDQVAESDLQYLCWMVGQNVLSARANGRLQAYLDRDATKALILALPESQRPPKPPGDYIVPFGTHAGRTIRQVAEIDERYVEWLATDPGILSVKLREAAKRFLAELHPAPPMKRKRRAKAKSTSSATIKPPRED